MGLAPSDPPFDMHLHHSGASMFPLLVPATRQLKAYVPLPPLVSFRHTFLRPCPRRVFRSCQAMWRARLAGCVLRSWVHPLPLGGGLSRIRVRGGQVCESQELQRAFAGVLKVGNLMNHGSPLGDAKAFRVDSLLLLHDVRSSDGKRDLLTAVVHMLLEHDASLTGLPHQQRLLGLACRPERLEAAQLLVGDLCAGLEQLCALGHAPSSTAAGLDPEALRFQVQQLRAALDAAVHQLVACAHHFAASQAGKTVKEDLSCSFAALGSLWEWLGQMDRLVVGLAPRGPPPCLTTASPSSKGPERSKAGSANEELSSSASAGDASTCSLLATAESSDSLSVSERGPGSPAQLEDARPCQDQERGPESPAQDAPVCQGLAGSPALDTTVGQAEDADHGSPAQDAATARHPPVAQPRGPGSPAQDAAAVTHWRPPPVDQPPGPDSPGPARDAVFVQPPLAPAQH